MQPSNGEAGEMDEIYTLLGKSRRRYLLYLLMENDFVNVDELTVQIAAWERDESITAVSEDARQEVYISLVHNHLPRLADHGVLEYDLRSGDIVLTSGFEKLEPLLTQFRRTEEVSEERLTSPPIVRRSN